MTSQISADRVLVDDWHVIADLLALPPGRSIATRLFGVKLEVRAGGPDSDILVTREDGGPVRVQQRHGFVWACLGTPGRDIVDIPEALEPDRPVTSCGSLGVHVSGPRAIENFLDIGHFPYVHTGYLGAEPETEVMPYSVNRLADGGLIATNCRFFQPFASPAAKDGIMVGYTYKVERPLTASLYKTNVFHTDRLDIIYLFVQPLDETHIVAHLLLIFMETGTSLGELRSFSQLILAQDKPILENQRPRRLPLGAGAEIPIAAADKSSIVYRSWLRELGLTYGIVRQPEVRRAAMA